MILKKNIIMIVKKVKKPFIPLFVKESVDLSDYSETIPLYKENKNSNQNIHLLNNRKKKKKQNKKHIQFQKSIQNKIISLSMSSIISWLNSLSFMSIENIGNLFSPFFLGFFFFSLFLLNYIKR